MRIIAGNHKNRMIKTPKGLATRPTSGRLRESLFNICQGNILDSKFLDLFAGSGAMGLEAISRGALSAIFIDSSRESTRCIEENSKTLKVEKQSQIICGDVFEHLNKLARRGLVFDIIYADPPYEKNDHSEEGYQSLSLQVLKFVDDHISLLASGGDLFLEDAIGTLPDPESLHLKNLRLKSARTMGKSDLQHYIRISLQKDVT